MSLSRGVKPKVQGTRNVLASTSNEKRMRRGPDFESATPGEMTANTHNWPGGGWSASVATIGMRTLFEGRPRE
jgi:hypothetical protein